MDLQQEVLDSLLKCCERAYPNETGGILYGSYSNDGRCVTISGASDSPDGSRAGKTWFERGVGKLQKLLNHLWKAKVFYLGEWHLHPNGSPHPSFQDISQLRDISRSKSYHCPEPILIIVGGRPGDFELQAQMFYNGGEYVTLKNESDAEKTSNG